MKRSTPKFSGVSVLFLLAGLVLLFALPSAALAGNVGYKGKFFIENDEQTFKLNIGGRVQPRLFWQKETGVATNPQVLSFQMRRALVDFSAQIHEIVSAGFALMHAVGRVAGTDFQTVNVVGATVGIEIVPELSITAGMVGLPLDIMSEASSKWFLLTEAPITSTQVDGQRGITELRPDFGTPGGLGVNFSGGTWKWFYSLSVVNGAESNYEINPNRKVSFGFRTGFDILDSVPGMQTDFDQSETPKLTVSAGSDYQGARNSDAGSRVKYIWTSSAGAAFRWKGLAVTTEGYYRRTRITSIASTDLQWARPRYTDIGYYAAVGYYIIPKKFEVAGQGGQIIRQGPVNDSWQFGGGLNYYIFDNNMKMQMDYTLTRYFNDVTGQRENRTHVVSLLATAVF